MHKLLIPFGALCVAAGACHAQSSCRDVPAAPMARASHEIDTGQDAAARDDLTEFLAMNPGDAKAHYMLGVADWRLQDNRDAFMQLQAAQRIDPGLSFALPAQFDGIEATVVPRVTPPATDIRVMPDARVARVGFWRFLVSMIITGSVAYLALAALYVWMLGRIKRFHAIPR